jgi:hypothetical protein
MHSHLRLSVLLPVGLVGHGCTAPAPEAEPVAFRSSCDACEAPPLVDWTLADADPSALFPDDVTHLHTLVAPGDSPPGSRRPAFTASDGPEFFSTITDAAAVHSAAGFDTNTSSAGAIAGGGGSPPNPVGDPTVVAIVLASAEIHEQATRETLAELNAL